MTLVPIHNMFVMWFTWSFANICCIFALMCCVMPVVAVSSQMCGEMVPKICGGLCFCGYCCSALACFITGAVYRFSEAGVYASAALEDGVATPFDDEYLQTSSGNFMYIYYMICFVLIGLECLCCMVGGVCKCIN